MLLHREKHISDVVEATGKLSKQIFEFIRKHYEAFLAFDDVKIYYGNGQIEVSKILSSVFNALLPNPIFRKVMPSEYKLFHFYRRLPWTYAKRKIGEFY